MQCDELAGKLMCEKCKEYQKDINAFIKGYGDKYTPQAIEELLRIRQELCDIKANCKCEQCFADDLINTLDTDPKIRKKKGL